VARLWPKRWTVPLALLSLALADATGLLCPPAHAQQTAASGKSWTDSITSPFKQGFDKLGKALDPKSATRQAPSEDDAISLKGKGKPGPELYVAVARLYEQAGKMAEAEQQYQLALKERPNDLPAMLGYAHLKEFLGKPDEAIELYQRAAKAYPREASVHNNLGLCYARQQTRLDEAVAAMNRAVQLDPKNPLYRNNIATVLVDQGKLRDAFGHLRAVYDTAAAYYNMGYLLNKKGQPQAALQHFGLALKADPSMDAARRWVDYLQRSPAQSRLSRLPVAMGVKVTSDAPRTDVPRDRFRQGTVRSDTPPVPVSSPASSQSMPLPDEAPAPPDQLGPQRLPPTGLDQSESDGSGLPGMSNEPSTAPSAPMPPPSTNSAVRMLPQVN
jgi:tetratricopeptide (TPR) repeat protein